MEPKLFRIAVNEKKDEYIAYLNSGSFKKWNVLCSCMDWLDSSYNFHVKSYIDDKMDDDFYSFYIFAKLMAIDCMIGAVEQLNNIAKDVKNSKILQGRSIFGMEISDRDWFKNLRAIFGAHPNCLDLEFKSEFPSKRYFASWSTLDISSSNMISAILYPIDDSGDKLVTCSSEQCDELVNVCLNELEKVYLVLDENLRNYTNVLKGKEIILTNNIIDNIELLTNENEKRLRNGLIKESLCELKAINKIESDEVLIMRYKDASNNLINVIKKSLENMQLTESEILQINDVLNPKVDATIIYHYGKVCHLLNIEDDGYGNYSFHFERIYALLGISSKYDEFKEWKSKLLYVKSFIYNSN